MRSRVFIPVLIFMMSFILGYGSSVSAQAIPDNPPYQLISESGDFVISDATGTQWEQDIAHDSQLNRFLVAWSDERSLTVVGGTNAGPVYARLLDENGVFLGPEILISEIAAYGNSRVKVTYNPTHSRYLVTWMETTVLVNVYRHKVFGQLLDADGNKLGSSFMISAPYPEAPLVNTHGLPNAVFNPVTGNFTVAWVSSGSTEIPNGTKIRNVSFDGSLLGSEVLIDTLAYPTLAVDPATGNTLLVYNYLSIETWGQFIDPSGNILGSPFLIGSYWNRGHLLAFDNVLNRFLVMGVTEQTGKLGGQFVGPDGTLIGGPFGPITTEDGRNLPSFQSGSKSLVYDPGQGIYLFLWYLGSVDTSYDVYGSILNSDGTMVKKDFVVSQGPGEQRLASGVLNSLNGTSVRSEFLVGWWDTRSDVSADVYGGQIAIIKDTDLDALNDEDELNIYGTDPNNIDTDGDGFWDGVEIDHGSDPLDPASQPLDLLETDGDGIKDIDEINIYNTDPNNYDTDGDGFSDGVELGHGSDPLDSGSVPSSSVEYAYVADSAGNNVAVVDTATRQVVTRIPVGLEPYDVLVSPDKQYVLVGNYSGSDVSVISTATHLEIDIDNDLNNGMTRFDSIPYPVEIAFNPDGTKAYVTNDLGVAVLNTSSLPFFHETDILLSNANGVGVTPDGAFVFVTAGSPNELKKIDTATNTIVDSYPATASSTVVVSPGATPDAWTVYARNGSNLVVVGPQCPLGCERLSFGSFRGGAEHPGGGYVYWSLGGVSVMDTSIDPTIQDPIISSVVAGSAWFMDTDEAGTYLYVPEYSAGTVAVVDTALAISDPPNAVVDRITINPVSRGAAGVALAQLSFASPGDTTWLSPTMDGADSGGDGDGYEVSAVNAYGDDGLNAVDSNSGGGRSTSCTSPQKDQHQFYNYGLENMIPGWAAIEGIEVRLDAMADDTKGSPQICIQLSWDGGASWTAAQSTAMLSTTMQTYILGSSADDWGRTWSVGDFSNPNFRVRVINVAGDTKRDFTLDWVAVRVTYGVAGPTTTTSTTSTTSTTTTSTTTTSTTSTTIIVTAEFVSVVDPLDEHIGGIGPGQTDITVRVTRDPGASAPTERVVVGLFDGSAGGTEPGPVTSSCLAPGDSQDIVLSYTPDTTTDPTTLFGTLVGTGPGGGKKGCDADSTGSVVSAGFKSFTNLAASVTTTTSTTTSTTSTTTTTTLPGNNAPVANAATWAARKDSTVSITLTGSDLDGDTLVFLVDTPPSNGTLGEFIPGFPTISYINYTPNPGYTGPDSFTFIVNDGQANSVPALVELTVGLTGFQNPSADASDVGGDGDGYEVTPVNAYGVDGLNAEDLNSGNGPGTSCTGADKDKHQFYNFGLANRIAAGATIQGVEVRLDAMADSTKGTPQICVQLSWDGGSSWTAPQSAPLGTSMQTYILGGINDGWGRVWSSAGFSDANFRLRVINVSENVKRDFLLDGVSVNVHY